jgi:hypothetical protein
MAKLLFATMESDMRPLKTPNALAFTPLSISDILGDEYFWFWTEKRLNGPLLFA